MIDQMMIEGLELEEIEFCPDDWETPDYIARPMADLILPSDQVIVEPSAGTGQIVKWLPRNRTLHAFEIKQRRIDRLKNLHSWGQDWHVHHGSFLEASYGLEDGVDVVITNPPFSIAIAFIERSLYLLDSNYEHARLLYLLPMQFFNTVENDRGFNRLDARIYQRHRIINRVGFLENGNECKNRQVYDCLYDIRPGRNGSSMPESVIRF